jgi:hypothetical protein
MLMSTPEHECAVAVEWSVCSTTSLPRSELLDQVLEEFDPMTWWIVLHDDEGIDPVDLGRKCVSIEFDVLHVVFMCVVAG